jgi:hypothetical protein
MSKVFERCLLRRIEAHNLDEDSQHGFRSHHGTTTAGLEVQHHIAKALDARKHVSLYTIDMSAAFDLLRPELMRSKLEVPKVLKDITMNFLCQRHAYVCVEKENSKVYAIPAGVPQGSVLGPKLFTIYTRGLTELIRSRPNRDIVIYADDSYVICQGNTKDEMMQNLRETLEDHTRWLRGLGMVVNSAKTEVMYFQDEKLSFDYEGFQLESVTTMNVLGVMFDNKLSWTEHLKKAKSACQRFKPALRHLKSRLNSKELLKVITSHYYSRLYYGSEIWFPCLKMKLKDSISALHYHPLRLVLNDFKRKLSRKEICELTQRANPFELNNYKMAKLLISITSNAEPYELFKEILSNSVVNRRKPENPTFLDMSRLRIGRQSIANRLVVAQKLHFEWLHVRYSKDSLRKLLKSTFYSYFNPKSF